MLDTPGLFESIDTDTTQRRVSSRRALALAHKRVEASLGRFLRGAQSEEEFFERLALVQEDFGGYIATAADEVGHDHPEHITASLVDHYKLAAAVNFEKTPAEEELEEEEEKEAESDSKASSFQARVARGEWVELPAEGLSEAHRTALVKEAPGKHHMPGVSDKRNRQYEHIKEQLIANGKDEEEAKEEAARTVNKQRKQHGETKSHAAGGGRETTPLAGSHTGAGFVPNSDPVAQAVQDKYRMKSPWERPSDGAWVQGVQGEMGTPVYPDDMLPPGEEQVYEGPTMRGENEYFAPHLTQPPVTDRRYGPIRQGASAPGSDTKRVDPTKQIDVSPSPVTCPECGGSGTQPNQGQCPKCHGEGKVQNFGDSMVDAVGADYTARTADDKGNTDLGGPEPKMDKSDWTESNPGEPVFGEGPYPTRRIDPMVPIHDYYRSEDDHDLEQIGENRTETVDLPSNESDTPFSTGGPTPVGQGGTFPNRNQTTPVTRETQSSHDWPSDEAVRRAFAR